MRISSFNSFYEVFAGISAAMVGFEQLRHFFIRKFAAVFHSEDKDITNHIDKCLEGFKEYGEFLKRVRQIGKHPDLEADITDELIEMNRLVSCFNLYKLKVNINYEVKKVERISYILFLCSFVLCVMFILVGGWEGQNYFRLPSTTLRFCAHIQVLGFPLMLWVGWWANKYNFKDKSGFKVSALVLATIIVGAFILNVFAPKIVPLNEELVILGTMMLSILPFLALSFRAFILWSFRTYIVNRQKIKAEAIYTKKSAYQQSLDEITDQILNMV